MDLDYIESLAELLAGTQVTELTVRRGDRSVTLRRQPGGGPVELLRAEPVAHSEPSTDVRPAPVGEPLRLPATVATGAALVPAEAAGVNGTPEYEIVRAHRVGVFHRGESTGAEPLIRVGDWAAPSQQLGSIESMCLFDEIDCPTGGVVVGVFVESGTAVEYGQPLFHLERRDRPPAGANGELS